MDLLSSLQSQDYTVALETFGQTLLADHMHIEVELGTCLTIHLRPQWSTEITQEYPTQKSWLDVLVRNNGGHA